MCAYQAIIAQIVYVNSITPNQFCAANDVKINGCALGGIKGIYLINRWSWICHVISTPFLNYVRYLSQILYNIWDNINLYSN